MYNENCKAGGYTSANNPEPGSLSQQLYKYYGPYFSAENIVRMAKFEEVVAGLPDLLQLAYFISWEHIIQLLPFDDCTAWLYYIRRVATNDWNADELQEVIASNEFEKQGESLKKAALRKALKKSLNPVDIDPDFLPLWFIQFKKTEWKPVFNVFKEPLLSTFRALYELRETSNALPQYTDNDLFIRITNRIDWTIPYLNHTLNQDFNVFMRETGRKTNPLSNHHKPTISNQAEVKEAVRVQIISITTTSNRTHEETNYFTEEEYLNGEKKVTEITERLLDTLFNDELLQNMILFAQKVTDSRMLFKIGHLVTWDKLAELLKLPDQDTILQYALKCADENLTKTQLKESIIQKMQSPSAPITKSKKTTVTDNEVLNKKVAVNIFNNNFFMKFVEAF